MDEDKSLASKVEVLDAVQKSTSLVAHREWLETAVKNLQVEFDDGAELGDKIKVFKLIEDYVKSEESNPILIINAIHSMPENKARVILALLEERNIIQSIRRKSKKSLFY